MTEGEALDETVKEVLDQAVRNMRDDENLNDQSIGAYFGIIEQFESHGHDLTLYRVTGEEMRRRLVKQNTPLYIRFWEAVKKIANYEVF